LLGRVRSRLPLSAQDLFVNTVSGSDPGPVRSTPAVFRSTGGPLRRRPPQRPRWRSANGSAEA